MFVVETVLCDNKVGTSGMVSNGQKKLTLILALDCEYQYFARSGI